MFLASQAGGGGGLKATPEQVIQTPTVIMIMVVFLVFAVCIGLAIAEYWHALEQAKKLHPNSIGYGKWYFSLIPRIWISVVAAVLIVGLWILAAFVIFVMPGPMLAQAYFAQKQKDQEQGVVKQLESDDLSLAEARVKQVEGY